MPRKPSTSAKLISTQIVDGKVLQTWEKVCPCCHKTYQTTSRSQKFCSDECCSKYNRALKLNRKKYDETKVYERLRVRAHDFAVAIMEQLVIDGVVEKKCACCGSTESLEVHHRSMDYLDNRPENLEFLCTKCHHQVHSNLDRANEGLTPEEIYLSSAPLIAPTLRK